MMIPLTMGFMMGCSETKTNATDLKGAWTIVEVKGNTVSQEKMPFMEFNFEDKRVHGNAGCNTFNSGFELKDDDASAISFGMAVSTMMACLDMELEAAVLKSLEEVKSVKTGKIAGQMLLLDKDGNVLFVLDKR